MNEYNNNTLWNRLFPYLSYINQRVIYIVPIQYLNNN